VLDFGLLNWLDRSQVTYPAFFDQLAKPNGTFNGKDITMYVQRTNQHQLLDCLQETIRVGYIDSRTIGCVASDVVLYLSLVFIIGVVAIRFFMAVLFGWFLSWRLGNFANESYTARRRRAAEIEQWTDDIYRPAPGSYRPNVQQKGNKKGTFLPNTSRFSRADGLKSGSRPLTTYGDQMKGRPVTTYSSAENRKSTVPSVRTGPRPT
jgi:chitin synthase